MSEAKKWNRNMYDGPGGGVYDGPGGGMYDGPGGGAYDGPGGGMYDGPGGGAYDGPGGGLYDGPGRGAYDGPGGGLYDGPGGVYTTVRAVGCMMGPVEECIQGQIQGLIWRFIRLGHYLQENSKEEEEFEKQN